MNRALVKMALKIADESSISLIETCCVTIRDKAGRRLWWEEDPADEYCGEAVKEAIDYLWMRGKVHVNPKNEDQFKVCR